MHRRGYKKHQLAGNRDSRRVLVRSLAGELIERRRLTTSLPKAKAVLPFVERLITKARKGGLHRRRQIIAKLGSPGRAHALVDGLAPRLSKRGSGYLRLERLERRRGDGALMARVSFVDPLEEEKPAEKPAETKAGAGRPKRPPAKESKRAAS